MCTEVEYNGFWITNIGEARANIGDENIMVSDGYSLDTYLQDDLCCCPIDWQSTAEKIGCVIEPYGSDFRMVPKQTLTNCALRSPKNSV